MKKLFSLQLLLLLIVSLFIFSCGGGDDEPEPEPPLVANPEGFFVTGTNTVATELTESSARMPLAVLEEGDAATKTMDGIYGKLIYIGAGGKIKFTHVVGEVTTVYGAANGGTVSNLSTVEGSGTNINDEVISGTLVDGATDIAVAEEGLYYAYVNLTAKTFILGKLEANVIGAATPLGWGAGTNLPLKSTSKDETIFEGKGIAMYADQGYRYRFFNGWQIFNKDGINTINNLSVKDYTEAWVAKKSIIGYFRSDIPHFEETGLYTITLKYSAASATWTHTKTKTGNILIDYTDYAMGIEGNGAAFGDFGGTGTSYGEHTPEVEGTVYTWTYNDVPLTADQQFIFLQDGTWGGMVVDFAGATTVEGDAITGGDIINATAAPISGEFPNFGVLTAGSYNITLVIDATANTKTVTINAAD